jgi:hypothetical protein
MGFHFGLTRDKVFFKTEAVLSIRLLIRSKALWAGITALPGGEGLS